MKMPEFYKELENEVTKQGNSSPSSKIYFAFGIIFNVLGVLLALKALYLGLMTMIFAQQMFIMSELKK